METVAAVVVTYNRAALLKRCLSALGSQTRRLDAIYIVDNASSDDTELAAREFAETTNIHVRYRKLSENVGGAGGFGYGTRIAHAAGFSQIWLTDDDGVPAPSALKELLAVDELAIRNSLVVDIENPEKLAFTLSNLPAVATVEDAVKKGRFLEGSVNAFNGTLVSSAVFDEIGFPYHGFFIWGDELDFIERARLHNFRIGTVTNAIHCHPVNKKPHRLFGRFTVSVVDDRSLPIFMRNYCYNLTRYQGLRAGLLFFLKQCFYEIIDRRSPSRLLSGVRASIDGIFFFDKEVRSGVKQPYSPLVSTSFET